MTYCMLGALYIASMIPHRLTLDDNRNWSSVSSTSYSLSRVTSLVLWEYIPSNSWLTLLE